MIGASSCLVGMNCTYKGSNNLVKGLKTLYEMGEVICVCPEVSGGLSTPRSPAEIKSFEPLYIENFQGEDVTKQYVLGAKKSLEILKEKNIQAVILKFRSPSCGNQGVYDGTFTHTLIDGQGVFAKLCQENDIQVFNENQVTDLLKYIGKEDEYGAYFKD